MTDRGQNDRHSITLEQTAVLTRLLIRRFASSSLVFEHIREEAFNVLSEGSVQLDDPTLRIVGETASDQASLYLHHFRPVDGILRDDDLHLEGGGRPDLVWKCSRTDAPGSVLVVDTLVTLSEKIANQHDPLMPTMAVALANTGRLEETPKIFRFLDLWTPSRSVTLDSTSSPILGRPIHHVHIAEIEAWIQERNLERSVEGTPLRA